MPYPTFPALAPDGATLKLVTKSQLFESDLSGAVQTAILPGDHWAATLTFSSVSARQSAIMRAFLAGVGGRAGRFWLPVPGYVRRGTAAGSGVVSGAGQSGKTLVTSGWTINQALLFDYADYIQVGNELYMVTAPVASSGTGTASIPVAPALRTSPANGAAIIVSSPACLMMMADDNQAAWEIFNSILYNMSVSCREALDI